MLGRVSRSVRLSVTPWAVARQAPLSTDFSRQEYWSGLSCPPPGDLPDPGIDSGLPHCRQILHPLSPRGSPSINCLNPGVYFVDDTVEMVWACSPCFTLGTWQGCTATVPRVSGSYHSRSGARVLKEALGECRFASLCFRKQEWRSGGLAPGWPEGTQLGQVLGSNLFVRPVLSPVDISEAVEQSPESAGRDLHVEVSGSPSTSHFWAWCLSCATRAATILRRL